MLQVNNWQYISNRHEGQQLAAAHFEWQIGPLHKAGSNRVEQKLTFRCYGCDSSQLVRTETQCSVVAVLTQQLSPEPQTAQALNGSTRSVVPSAIAKEFARTNRHAADTHGNSDGPG